MKPRQPFPDVVTRRRGRERILENAPQRPRGTHRLETDQKAAALLRLQQPMAHLKGLCIKFTVFLSSSWCLPNGMMSELKINKRLGKQRKLVVMVQTAGISVWGSRGRRIKS